MERDVDWNGNGPTLTIWSPLTLNSKVGTLFNPNCRLWREKKKNPYWGKGVTHKAKSTKSQWNYMKINENLYSIWNPSTSIFIFFFVIFLRPTLNLSPLWLSIPYLVSASLAERFWSAINSSTQPFTHTSIPPHTIILPLPGEGKPVDDKRAL